MQKGDQTQHPPPVMAQPMQPGYGPGQHPPPYPPGPGGHPPPGPSGYGAGPPAYGPAPGGHPPAYGMVQPGHVGPPPEIWMAPPAMETIPDCPKGLEYLTLLDQVLVKQKTHMLEVLLDYECANKYKILNNQGQQAYYAFEKSNFLCRQCCGSNRKFKIHVADNNKKTIFSIKRPFKPCAGLSWCAMCRCSQDEVSVYAKDGTQLGYVRQACSSWKPHYFILDHDKDPQFEVWGPCCPCTLCNGKVDFAIRPIGSDTVVANINKQWSGFAREYFTDSDNFGIKFPMDLDVRMKATLIGAVFLIDFMYFEDNESNRSSMW